MIRCRKKFNRIKQLTKRRASAKAFINTINERLALGWNPAVTSIAPRATTKLFEALDLFLKVKAKEAEENSMRSYRSYISMFKTWLKDKELSEDAYVCAITYEVAMELMDDSSENNIRRAIATAEAVAPCVLWIDEIEKGLNVGGEREMVVPIHVFSQQF